MQWPPPPWQLGLLPLLEHLRLNDNLLTSIIPPELATAVSLTKLDLSNNYVMCGLFNSSGTSSVADFVEVSASTVRSGDRKTAARVTRVTRAYVD